jgi:hypothetical protein
MTLSQSLPPVPGLAEQIHESSRQDADIAASVEVPVSADAQMNELFTNELA